MIFRTVLTAIFLISVISNSAHALKFIAYGDCRDNLTENSTQSALWETENPGCIVHSGDVWGGTSQASWKATFTGKTNLNALLNANKVCVARGNHETWAQLTGFTPSLVKSSSTEYYSFTEGNCFFVSMGYDPAQNYTWLRQQLSSAASTAARWRFVFMHKPIYSGYSGHGADGVTSEGSAITMFRNYCDTFKVTMTFSGHDHGYERTRLIYHGAVVSSGTVFNLDLTPGTVYVMTGGGGAPFYTPSTQWWTAFTQAVYNFQVVDARTDTCYVSTKINSGAVIDQWMFIHSPSGTLAPEAANEGTPSAAVQSLGNRVFVITGPAGSPYSIVDLSGKVAASGRLSAAKERIDLTAMQNGVYFIKINGCIQKIFLK